MKINPTASGFTVTVKLPVVTVIPNYIPDDDGTGEAPMVFYSPTKTVYTFDQASGTWAAGGGALPAQAAHTVIGNATAGSAVPTAMSVATAQTLLAIQAPSAVAITGGTVAGVTLDSTNSFAGVAGTTLAGLETLFDTEAQIASFMKARIGQLTDFKPILINTVPTGISGAGFGSNNGTGEGGTLNLSAVAGLTGGIFQTPKTGKWAVGGLIKFPAITSGQVNQFGIENAAGTHAVWVGNAQSVSATAWVLRVIGAANTTATGGTADTTTHTFVLGSDGTTISLWIDLNATPIATITDYTNINDESMGVYGFSTNANAVKIFRAVFGYVQSA